MTAPRTSSPVRALSTIAELAAEAQRLYFDRARRDHRSGAAFLQRVAAKMVALHRIEATISGTLPAGPFVLVANHLGYLDPMLLAAICPVVPIAKKEIALWPMLGSLFTQAGVIFVDRSRVASGAAALFRARRALAAGASVLNFPEGTTSDGSTVLPFRRGIFGLAIACRAPVVPARITFEDRSLAWIGDQPLLPHYLELAGRERVRIQVTFGPPLDPTGPSERLAETARTFIRGAP